MAFKLGTLSIFELGQFISEKLRDDGVEEQAILSIYVNEDEFKKVDEDLYYRNRTDEKQEFVPSDGEIIVNFDNVKILIKSEK